eukprot:gene1008-9914_t
MPKKSKKELKHEQEEFNEEQKTKKRNRKDNSKVIEVTKTVINSDNEEEEITTEKFSFEDDIFDAIEKMELKDRETRIEGLKKLKDLISKNYVFDCLYSEKENVMEICLSILQKSLNEYEIDYSTSIICLLVLTYEEEYLGSIYEKIKKIFSARMFDDSISNENRKLFLNKIGIIHFILAEEEEIESVLEELKKIWSKESNNEILKISSLHSWNLLLTRIPNFEKVQELEKIKHILIKILNNKKSSTDFILEIGESLAILYEALHQIGKKDKNQLDLLLDSLEELKFISTKQKSKKDKKIQRAVMKDVLATIEDGEEAPVHKLIIKQDKFEFYNWNDIIILNFLKEILQNGLNTHFIQNPLIQEIFDF